MDFEKLVSRARATLLAAAAASAASAVLAAAPTGGHRAQLLAPEHIRNFLPSSLGVLERGDVSAERITALGTPISQAEAQYRDDKGHYVTVRIEDMGGASGLKSLVPWASVNKGKQTSSGDEKTYRSRGRRVHEKWDPPAAPNAIGYGEYAVIVGQRYLIEASGQVGGLDVLKSAVRSVDIAKLKSAKTGRGN